MPKKSIGNFMQISVISIIIYFFSAACGGNPKCEDKTKDEIIQIVQENSLFRDSLDWKRIESMRDCLCLDLRESRHIKFEQFLIKELRAAGDKHSFLLSGDNLKTIKSSGISDSLPKGKIIQNDIGYLLVNTFLSFEDSNLEQYATSLQHRIKTIDESTKIRGWIIDLRENHGGNMWPMIAGLGPLLRNGIAGYFVKPGNANHYAWTYLDGEFGKIKVKDFYLVKNLELPIAILTGNRTASSGEMTLIAFLGKENVKTFGLPTGGFVTANSTYKLADGNFLNLATAYVEDRLNKRYMNSIRPDVIINCKATDPTDVVIEAAVTWIHSKN